MNIKYNSAEDTILFLDLSHFIKQEKRYLLDIMKS